MEQGGSIFQHAFSRFKLLKVDKLKVSLFGDRTGMKRNLIAILFYFVFLCRCGVAAESTNLVEAVKEGRSEIFRIDFERLRPPDARLPIGVFDSGIGGLTVLDAILGLDYYDNKTGEPGGDGIPDFEHERFIYLGDQANMPYGNYPSGGKTAFLRELVLRDALFLLGNRYWPAADSPEPRFDKPAVKAVVIACNTATSYGLPDILDAMKQWELPVYVVGVVDAGAKGALRSVKGDGAVGVLATVATCNSLGYVRAVESEAARLGIAPPVVVQQGSLGLAGAIEGDRAFIGWNFPEEYKGPAADNPEARLDTTVFKRYGFEPTGVKGDTPASVRLNSVVNYLRYDVLSLVENYRRSGGVAPIRAVILGCTHFPFHRDEFVSAFERLRTLRTEEGERPYESLLDSAMALIDPADLTGIQLYEELMRRGLLLADSLAGACHTDEFYISTPVPDLPGAGYTVDGAFTHTFKYGRNEGEIEVEYVRRVPMSSAGLPPDSRDMIREKMPRLWERLERFNRDSPRTKGTPGSLRLN